jgi:hypothetical protein
MPDFYSNSASDNFRLLKSKPLSGAAATAGTWSLLRIPKWAFISGVWVMVETACNVTDITIGWSGNTETAVPTGFLSADIVDAGVVGIKFAERDTLVSGVGKYFDKGTGSITATLGTTWATGKIHVFCQYSVIR